MLDVIAAYSMRFDAWLISNQAASCATG